MIVLALEGLSICGAIGLGTWVGLSAEGTKVRQKGGGDGTLEDRLSELES